MDKVAQLVGLYIFIFHKMYIYIVSFTTENIFQCCDDCKHISRCKKRLNKHNQGNLKLSLPLLCEMGILDFDETEIERIKEIYDLRNRVHIRLAEENEFLDNSFCQETHNELIEILIRTTERLNVHAVPRYGGCDLQEKYIVKG